MAGVGLFAFVRVLVVVRFGFLRRRMESSDSLSPSLFELSVRKHSYSSLFRVSYFSRRFSFFFAARPGFSRLVDVDSWSLLGFRLHRCVDGAVGLLSSSLSSGVSFSCDRLLGFDEDENEED